MAAATVERRRVEGAMVPRALPHSARFSAKMLAGTFRMNLALVRVS